MNKSEPFLHEPPQAFDIQARQVTDGDFAIRFLLSCFCSHASGLLINLGVIGLLQSAPGSLLMSALDYSLCIGPPLLLGWYAAALCARQSPIDLLHRAHLAFFCAGLLLAYSTSFVADPTGRAINVSLACFATGIGWSFLVPARMAVLASFARPEIRQKISLWFSLMPLAALGMVPPLLVITSQNFSWVAPFSLAAMLAMIASLAVSGEVALARHVERRKILRDLEGMARAVRGNPCLRQIIQTGGIIVLVYGPITIQLGKLGREQFGFTPLQAGQFLGLVGPSLIIGGLLCIAIARRIPHGLVLTGGSILIPVLLGSMSLISVSGQREAVIALCLIGIIGGLCSGLVIAGIQAMAPPILRGRILGYYGILALVLPDISAVTASTVSHFFRPATAFAVCGSAIALLALVNFAFARELRSYSGRARNDKE